jgi:hypothetical protein
MIIYCIQNLINGKKYIGQSSRFNSNEEFQKSNYWGSGKYIRSAINKYGLENFKKWVMIKDIPYTVKGFDELNHYEILWISKLKTKQPQGYNITDGGDGIVDINGIVAKKRGKTFSERHQGIGKGRKQASEHIKKRFLSRTWYKHSIETKQKISEKNKNFYKNHISSQKNKKKSDEHVKNLSLAWIKRRENGKGHPNLGCKRTELNKQHYREACKKRIYILICLKCKNKFESKTHNKYYCDDCKKTGILS